MRKLIAILVILISAGLHQVSFAQNNSIAGVSLDLTSSDFMEQIGAKAAEIASSLKAKKCSVSVNEGLAKDIQKVCYVDINLEYKGSEDVMPLAMLRSAFNAKYGVCWTGNACTVMARTDALFWKTPYGEIALFEFAGKLCVRIFNYSGITESYTVF